MKVSSPWLAKYNGKENYARQRQKISPEDDRKRLAARTLEFFHEAGESFDGGEFHGIVERDAHAPDGAVAGSADKCGGFGLPREFLFHGFVATGNAEDDVHQRT